MIERDENGLAARIVIARARVDRWAGKLQCVRELCEWRRERSHCRMFHEKPVFGCIFCIIQKSPPREHGGYMYEAAEKLMKMKEDATGKNLAPGKAKMRKTANDT